MSDWMTDVQRGPPMKFLHSLAWDEDAATAVEYAVMLAFILSMIFAAVSAVGAGSGGMWGGNSAKLNEAINR